MRKMMYLTKANAARITDAQNEAIKAGCKQEYADSLTLCDCCGVVYLNDKDNMRSNDLYCEECGKLEHTHYLCIKNARRQADYLEELCFLLYSFITSPSLQQK